MGRTMAGWLSRTSGTSRVRSPKKTEWPALRNEAKVKMAPTQAAMAKTV